MDESTWTRWIIQTARSWPDIAGVVKQTGIESVDQEHRQLIESALDLNRLIELFESNDISLDVIKKEAIFLERLREVTANHFQHEEQLIQRYRLRNLPRQQHQHQQFLQLLDTFIHDFDAGRMWVSLNLKMSVLEWVVHHINRVDYDTFCVDPWMAQALDAARTWEDLEALIKPTGLHRLDEEHKDLVILTLGLNQWIDEPHPEGQQSLLPMIDRIDRYASHHFQHEEQFMRLQGMPHLDQQQDKHEQFLAMLDGLRRQTANPRQIKQQVMNWWVSHINGLDYETFRLEAWVGSFLGSSSSWDSLTELVKTTGLDQLDQEHQDLLMLTLEANDVVEAFQRGKLSASLRAKALEILRHLKDYSSHHFAGEEALIQRYAIPGLGRQQKAHAYFIEFMDDLIRDIGSGRMVFSARVKTRIIAWWTGHINTVDYQTFRLDNWASALFAKARRVEDVLPILKRTDIPWVDRDHQQVVVLALELSHLMATGDTPPPRARDLITEIFNYSGDHFQREEDLFRQVGYSGLDAHQDKHHAFLREMSRWRDDPAIWSREGLAGFQVHLLHWWLNHINGVDFHDFRSLTGLAGGVPS